MFKYMSLQGHFLFKQPHVLHILITAKFSMQIIPQQGYINKTDHSTLLLQDIYCFVACFGIRFKVPVVVSTVLCDLATVSFSVYSYSSQCYLVSFLTPNTSNEVVRTSSHFLNCMNLPGKQSQSCSLISFNSLIKCHSSGKKKVSGYTACERSPVPILC